MDSASSLADRACYVRTRVNEKTWEIETYRSSDNEVINRLRMTTDQVNAYLEKKARKAAARAGGEAKEESMAQRKGEIKQVDGDRVTKTWTSGSTVVRRTLRVEKPGTPHGRLTVVEDRSRHEGNKWMSLYDCACGNQSVERVRALVVGGRVTSCGKCRRGQSKAEAGESRTDELTIITGGEPEVVMPVVMPEVAAPVAAPALETALAVVDAVAIAKEARETGETIAAVASRSTALPGAGERTAEAFRALMALTEADCAALERLVTLRREMGL